MANVIRRVEDDSKEGYHFELWEITTDPTDKRERQVSAVMSRADATRQVADREERIAELKAETAKLEREVDEWLGYRDQIIQLEISS